MRPETQALIDALHAQIDALVEEEKLYHDGKHAGEGDLHRQIAHTHIEHCARSPKDRSLMYWASARFPVLKGTSQ